MPRPADVPKRSVAGQDTITTRTAGITLKLIPDGLFEMGSPPGGGYDNAHPLHQVRITRPFYLGVTEVTQAQYEAVMGNNPSHFSATGEGRDKVTGQSTGQHPVESVSWLDAVKFCNKLSEMEGRKPFYEINGENARVADWKAPVADGGRVGIRVRGRSCGPQRARLVRRQFRGCDSPGGEEASKPVRPLRHARQRL
jgi:hypothetical protein